MGSRIANKNSTKSNPRPDISDWVLHFIHDRNPKYEPLPATVLGEGAPEFFPACANLKKNVRFTDFWISEQENHPLEGDAPAFSVLQKILAQGLIKSGWSFRNGWPTIYGPRSAICFTEMPLSSLVTYSRSRKDEASVHSYAIGLLKSELYKAGGRPVFYGLTAPPTERPQSAWPRILSPKCGIGEAEQYRYVSFNLGPGKEIDWTHEREWRWADHLDKLEIPGLPIWRANTEIAFSSAFVIVQTAQEANKVLSHLRRCLDTQSDIAGNPYNPALLKATNVVSLERLETEDLLQPDASLRIENIPSDFKQPVPAIPVSDEAKARARLIIKEALQAASAAAAEWRKAAHFDVCGFAELVIEDGLSEFTRAGLELSLLTPISGIDPFGSGGYWLEGVTSRCESQSLAEKEAAAKAAEQVIRTYLPDLPMHVWTRWD